ncbi:MAG: PIN domain-containing protein [Hyphomicrobiales bacterium]|nr:PIN domain-containing protein [Hyphomicrobiales bacterium]
MSGDFFDTNVLLHLLSEDAEKADRAERVVRGGGRISVQVLNEAASVMRRRLRMSRRETREFLTLIRSLLDVAPVTLDTHDLGLEFAERYGLSIYDSMIAAAAALSGSARLWSQDMQHGIRIGERLRVENPFR